MQDPVDLAVAEQVESVSGGFVVALARRHRDAGDAAPPGELRLGREPTRSLTSTSSSAALTVPMPTSLVRVEPLLADEHSESLVDVLRTSVAISSRSTR